jgi:hypothetical protein
MENTSFFFFLQFLPVNLVSTVALFKTLRSDAVTWTDQPLISINENYQKTLSSNFHFSKH